MPLGPISTLERSAGTGVERGLLVVNQGLPEYEAIPIIQFRSRILAKRWDLMYYKGASSGRVSRISSARETAGWREVMSRQTSRYNLGP